MTENKQFDREYLCYSFSTMNTIKPESVFQQKADSNQIILPVDAMKRLVDAEIPSPYQFRIYTAARELYVGVIQFTANDKLIYVPDWMIDFLGIEDGGRINIVSVTVPKATRVRFEVSDEFLKTSNPKVVVEVKLRPHMNLRLDQVIRFDYAKRKFKMRVVELEPAAVCSIVDADVELEMCSAESRS